LPAAMLATSIVSECTGCARIERPIVCPVEDAGASMSPERQWAIIPEVGYDPESGGLGGAKFTHRNVAGTGPRSTSRRPTHGTARRA